MPTLPEPAPTLLQASRQNDEFLKVTGRFIIFSQVVCSQKKTKTKQYQKVHFFFYKNIFYKNVEVEICKILRI